MGRYIVRGTVLLVVLTVLVMPLVATAQQPVQVRRIAFLGFGSLPSAAEPNPFAEAFRQALHARGWVEGHTITIEWRWAEGSGARFATLVAEVVQLPVELLVVPNATTAGIARRATTTIPIVVVGGGSLLEAGLVASLARPGGNITGVHTMAREVVPKRLEVLKQALPEVTRVAVLRGGASFRNSLPALEEMARALGMALHLFDVREPTAFGPSTLPLEETARLFDVREPTALDNAFAAMTQCADARPVCAWGGLLRRLSRPDCRPRGPAPLAVDLRVASRRRGRLPHELWPEQRSPGTAHCLLCRSHPARCQAGRPAGGAADAVRVRHQSQDGPGPRAHAAARGSVPGGRDHPLSAGHRAPRRQDKDRWVP